jgi:predicted O-methyltransferase YrrM
MTLLQSAWSRARTPVKKSIGHALKPYNMVVGTAYHSRQRLSDDAEIAEIERATRRPTEISSHLPALYRHTDDQRPALVVELGTRVGFTTSILVKAAAKHHAHVVSIDIDDCSGVVDYDRWQFVQSDDIAFAREFVAWAEARDLPTSVDVLFIDTSHHYEHTVQEIASWFPLLAPDATVLFHDTNMQRFYRRRDNTVGIGSRNQRAVIRAIEEYLGAAIDETRVFAGRIGDWDVQHEPRCSGFTVLRRAARADS